MGKILGGCLTVTVIAALIIGSLMIVGVIGFGGRVISDAATAVYEEVNPRELNRKYEWFKNAYAQLDSFRGQASVKQNQIDGLVEMYDGVPRNEWNRADIQAHRQYTQELAGIKGSFNNLAAEYNAEMAKWHTAFVNAGKLPEGGSEQMPREVAVYITE